MQLTGLFTHIVHFYYPILKYKQEISKNQIKSSTKENFKSKVGEITEV